MINKTDISTELFSCLPDAVCRKILDLMEEGKIRFPDLAEIRLRVGGSVSLTHSGENIPIGICVDSEEMQECVIKLCRGSFYSHEGTVRAGYIMFDGGVRIGVCGTFTADGKGIREITSLNIRIPHIIREISGKVLDICIVPSGIKSLLIYSAPGVGKTTLLRDLASVLSVEYMRRVALIDTRGELYIKEMFAGGLCDVLSGYPRGLGMEIATRTLSPEVIICDEIGDMEEAKKILEMRNTGVPIIASAHGDSLTGLLRRPSIRLLHENGIFDGYMKIWRPLVNGRMSNSLSFDYTAAEETGI